MRMMIRSVLKAHRGWVADDETSEQVMIDRMIASGRIRESERDRVVLASWRSNVIKFPRP